jgi:hypothetical protein
MGQREISWGHYVGAMGGGFVAVTFAGYLHYQWQIEARRGVLMMFAGQRLGGASAMGNGLFGSIVGAMMVGAAVLLAVLIAQWVTLDIRAGVAMAVLSLVPLAWFNLRVADYLIANPLPATMGVPEASTYQRVLMSTFSEMLIPAAIGLVIGYIVNVKTRDRLSREASGIVFEATPPREEPGMADPRIWDPPTLDADGTMTVAAPVAYEAPPEALPQPEPVQPQPTAHEHKRAIMCVKCGASNVPLRSNCLRCGAALA